MSSFNKMTENYKSYYFQLIFNGLKPVFIFGFFHNMLLPPLTLKQNAILPFLYKMFYCSCIGMGDKKKKLIHN